jgi:hypothetical protein
MKCSGAGRGYLEGTGAVAMTSEEIEREKQTPPFGVPEGRVKIRGMAKQQQPRVLEVLEGQMRPAEATTA